MTVAESKLSQASSRTISAKQAAKLALKYFSDLFPEAQISDVALEEVEFSDDGNYWLITLGYNTKDSLQHQVSRPALAASLFGPPSSARKYKVFKVAARTGKVVAMKIRKLE